MLDRTRLVTERRLGVDAVDPASYFEEGSLLQWGASGWALSASATANVPRALAGLNRLLSPGYNVVINEPVILVGVIDSVLNHAPVKAASYKVTDLLGTPYTEGAGNDYIMTIGNGLIKRDPLSTIVDGDTVLVSYTYPLTKDEMDELVGMPLSNDLDETLGASQVVAFQGDCIVAITNYDSSLDYVAGAPLFDKGDGLLTSDGSGAKIQVGFVKTPPSAGDRFLVAQLSL